MLRQVRQHGCPGCPFQAPREQVATLQIATAAEPLALRDALTAAVAIDACGIDFDEDAAACAPAPRGDGKTVAEGRAGLPPPSVKFWGETPMLISMKRRITPKITTEMTTGTMIPIVNMTDSMSAGKIARLRLFSIPRQ